jgi:hypothetical protein
MTLAPLPTFLQPRTVRVNLDTLVHMHDSRPATKLGAKAWEWLAECDAFVFEGEALLVPSATWDKHHLSHDPYLVYLSARASGLLAQGRLQHRD